MEASLIWTVRKDTLLGLNWTTLTPQHTILRSKHLSKIACWTVDEQHNLVVLAFALGLCMFVPSTEAYALTSFANTDPIRGIGFYAAFNGDLRCSRAVVDIGSNSCLRVYYGATKLAVKPLLFAKSKLCVKVGNLKVISKTLKLIFRSFAVVPISETCFLICGGASDFTSLADVIVVDVDTKKLYKGPRLLKPAQFINSQVNKSGAVFCIEDIEHYFHKYDSKLRRWRLLSTHFWKRNRGLLFVAKRTWNKHETRLKACLLKEALTFL
jgi:hypothetical protein